MSLATTFRNQITKLTDFLPVSRKELKSRLVPDSIVSSFGVVTDEDLEPSPDWQNEEGIRNARKMLRTDSQSKGIMRAIKLTILASGATIEPASEDAKDVDNAEFIRMNLFENNNYTFQKLLEHWLFYLEHGFEIMGKEFEERDGNLWWKNWIHIKPEAIQDVNIFNGHLVGVEYLTSHDDFGSSLHIAGGQTAHLEFGQIFHIANEQEGSNWRGIPLLRSSWKNFIIKDMLIRTDAIRHERFGSPTPVGVLKNNNQRTEVEDVLEKYRVNSKGYIVMDETWKLTQFPENAGRVGTDIIQSVEYHDKQAAGSTVMDFLTTSRLNVGSNAKLGREQDFFMMLLGAIFGHIEGILNRGDGLLQHIRHIIDINFGRPANGYPKFTFVRPTLCDAKEFADTITGLITSRAIKRRPGDEEFIRQRIGHRELTAEEIKVDLEEFQEDDEGTGHDDEGMSGHED